MLVTGLLVVLLSSHGEAATREEKFRGALVEQAPVETRGSSFENPDDLKALIARRPSLDGAGAALGVGGVFSGVGLVTAAVGIFVRSGGTVFALLIGGLSFGVGMLAGIIGGVVMAVLGAELARVDTRIRELERRRAVPALSDRFAAQPMHLLARF